MINKGYRCKCGWIGVKPKIKRSKGVSYDVCPECSRLGVKEWERPLNEREGRCSECGNGSFKLKVVNGDLLRTCKECETVVNAENIKV